MWLIILASVLTLLVYLKTIKPLKHWEKKEIACLKPWPIFGNMAPTIFRRCAIGDLINDMYKAFPGKRYFGIYQFFQPTLVIRDPELIKQITVDEPDHRTFSSHFDPLWSRNLFSLNSVDGWEDMRATLTPSFTSSNMRMMYVLMAKCAQQFTDHFQKPKGTIEIELKDAFTRYTNDVIGSTAFGVTCDSLKHPDNDFYLIGKDATNYTGLRLLKFFGYTISPTLMKLFKIRLFSQEVTRFFRRHIKETLKNREEKQIVRLDILHSLIEERKARLKNGYHTKVVDSEFAVVQELGEARENQKLELSEDDIIAQALIFFIIGFDTASTLMCYTAYELALNPEVQDKLREEIQVTVEACKGKLSYEALLGMKYLDNVISENLRKWPPCIFTDRKSVKPFTIVPEEPEKVPLHLEAGTVCWIPIYALHRNPDHYLEPDKFDPDRFNDENRNNIKPFTYIPFGAGPRNCIASRFALLESKLIIVEILRKFEIVPVGKTTVPLVMSKRNFTTLPDDGIWIGLLKNC